MTTQTTFGPVELSPQQSTIFKVLSRNKRGLTDEQISYKTGINYESVSRRRRELVSLGVVNNTWRVRRGSSGYDAMIWTVA